MFLDEDQTKGVQKRNGEASPVESLSHRLERIELLNDHRDELLLQCAQSRRLLESFLCRTWLVEGDVASFQPFAAARAQGKAYNEVARGQKKHQMGQPFMSVFAAFVNGLDCVAARVSQEAHLGTGHGSFPRVEHSRDPPERGTSTHSGTIQDVRNRSCSPRGCTEHHQTGTHSTQSSFAPQGHRAGRPSTADEQRAKNSESTQAARQESGGQIRLGDEIDIYETDLAESLAMWGFGEPSHRVPLVGNIWLPRDMLIIAMERKREKEREHTTHHTSTHINTPHSTHTVETRTRNFESHRHSDDATDGCAVTSDGWNSSGL